MKKLSKLLLIVCLTSTICSAQYRNFDKITGAENPHGYVVIGDSVELYKRDSAGWVLTEKQPFNRKILTDLRVMNRNQARLENWLLAIMAMNIVMAVALWACYDKIRRNR